ncbi:MAG: putative toxin-antitoxin system toxin component, PIN family [Solirubrobacteraceae bacterium]
MRAVLDPNVVISALLSPRGAPAQVLRAFEDGAFELVVSELLLEELGRALAYPKLSSRIPHHDALDAVSWLRRSALVVDDEPPPANLASSDPGDDYLLGIAAAQRCLLVSGDHHLLDLAPRLPVVTARDFLGMLDAG